MIAAFLRLLPFARPLQPDAVRLADVIAERENLRRERDEARAALVKSEARRAAEFDAAERYIAERDRALKASSNAITAAGFWMSETHRVTRLLDVQSAARLGGHDLPADVAVLSQYRRTRPESVSLPFLGPISS